MRRSEKKGKVSKENDQLVMIMMQKRCYFATKDDGVGNLLV